MNGFKATCRRLNTYLAAALLVISSCCEQVLEVPKMDGFIEHELLNPNLIRNAGFETWDTTSFPTDWKAEEIYNYIQMFNLHPDAIYGKKALKMERNSKGVHRLFQKVQVEKGFIYELSVNIKGTINNYSAGGIEPFASSGESLGKHFVTYSTIPDYKKLSVKFINTDSDSLNVTIGFPDGMDAAVLFDNVVLKKAQTGEFSPALNELAAYLELQPFYKNTFDTNIEKIASKLNELLIGGYVSYLQTSEPSYLEASDDKKKQFVEEFGPLLSDPYLQESFARPSSMMAEAYCQRISLNLSKILAHFNIATRQIHWVKDGVGFHQFLEYWNPFKKRWIILDPFYGVKYSVDINDLGSAELLALVENGEFNNKLIRKIDVGRFYFSEDEIMNGWNTYIKVQRFGDIRRTLP